MSFDYFYGEQSEQFSFYRIPKLLFTDEAFRELSAEAKVLYGILLDRMSLSAKNGWMDSDGRVYIIFTTEQVMKAMNCADNKATKLLSELENKAGLIRRKRMGLGKPNRIYVKNFISSVDNSSEQEEIVDKLVDEAGNTLADPAEERFKNRENHDSGVVKTTTADAPKSRCNNTDISNTDKNDTESFSSIRKGRDAMEERSEISEYFKDVLDMDILKHDYPADKKMLDEILDLVTDVCCTKKPFIRIAGDDKPAEAVKSQFMKLTSEHIRYVLHSLKDNITRVRDPRQYLTAALYNATMTKETYYQSWVNSDMANVCSMQGRRD